MALKTNVTASILLTLIMLLSIGMNPVNVWDSDNDDRTNDTDRTVIVYSQLDGLMTEESGARGEGRAEVQSTLVIVSQFSDDASSRWTNNEVNSLIFDDMSDLFVESSYGEIEVDGQVVGPFSLPSTSASYQYVHASWGVGIYRFEDGDGGGGAGVINDALDALVASQPNFDFSQFDYLIVLVNGGTWRGLGGGSNTFTVDNSDGTSSNVNFDGTSLVGENDGNDETSVWGRIAHEFGHQLGLGHVTVSYDNPYDLMASLYPGHPSAFTKEGQPGFQDEDNWMVPSRINTLVSPSVDTYSLQPLEMDTGPTQVLKIPLAGDVYYMVEVRLQIRMDDMMSCSAWTDADADGALDDVECTSWSNTMPDEGVFIYRVNPNDYDSAESKLPVQLVDSRPSTTTMDDALFKVGDTFQLSAAGGTSADGAVHLSDTSGKDIFISIVSESEGSYSVYVEYDKPSMEPPDLFINDWDPTPWASVDIWVDSELNEWFKYKYHVDGDDGTPDVGNGDDPWANHVNRVYARVANTGEYDAEGVTIEYYYNDPMGIGDDGDWMLIDKVEDVTVPAGSTITPYVEWTPVIPGLDPYTITNFHACLKVVVLPHADEIDTGNNEAQENIKYFETRSSSPFHDVGNEFEVANPFNHSSQVMLEITVDTPGWDAQLDWYSLVLRPNEVRTNNFSISPPGGVGVGVPGIVHLTGWYVEGLPDGSLHIIPLGGISISVTPVEKIDIVLSIDSTVLTEGLLSFTGILIGQGLSQDSTFDSSVALVLTSPSGVEHVIHADLTSSGNDASFSGSIDVMGLEPITGDWKIQAWYAGDRHHEADAGVVTHFSVASAYIIVPNYIIDPIHTPTISWGDDYLGSGTLVYPIAPGTTIGVLYTSPSGDRFQESESVDSQGGYSTNFLMNESGTWTVDYSYTDSNGVERSWSDEVVVEENKEGSGIPSVGFISALSMVALAATLIRRRRID